MSSSQAFWGADDYDQEFDHLIVAAPDMEQSLSDFESLLGIQAQGGGSHAGLGTCNALFGLGAGRYLEVVGPDPGQPEFVGSRRYGLDTLTDLRLVTWCLRPADLDERIAALREEGYDPGEVRQMTRHLPDGGSLHWRVATHMFHDPGPALGGVVPFMIDWGQTVHPSTNLPVDLELVGLHAYHPEPARAATQTAAWGGGLRVFETNAPRLEAVLQTPNGRVVLS